MQSARAGPDMMYLRSASSTRVEGRQVEGASSSSRRLVHLRATVLDKFRAVHAHGPRQQLDLGALLVGLVAAAADLHELHRGLRRPEVYTDDFAQNEES